MSEETKKIKVLFVDDDPVYLRAMKEGIQDEYDVKIAVDGDEALFEIDRIPPDIVFLDYDMPGVDGRDCLAMIRGMTGGGFIKVVFVTGERKVGKVVDVMNFKPAGYMTKPVTIEEIKAKIKELMGQ